MKGAFQSESQKLSGRVQSGMRGDKAAFRKVVETIIAEERSKQHKVLAEKIEG